MKLSRIFLTAATALALVGCYNKFDMPEVPVRATDNDLKIDGYQHITIAELKAMFGEVSGTGNTNDDWSQTMYYHLVANERDATTFERDNHRYIVGNYYIKGKVTSNDEQGNVYKSLYIFDGTEAIELKLTNGLFIDYPCEVKENGKTVWVYVKLTGLYLGNNRMMLSLGDIPTMSLNSIGRTKCYPNSNLVSPNAVREHVLLGEDDTLTYGRLANDGSNYNQYDILEVDEDNYTNLFRNTKYYGRMIMFRNLSVVYRGLTDQNGDYTDDLNGNYYPAWTCTTGTMESNIGEPFVDRPWGRLAYSIDNIALTSQFLTGYGSNPETTSSSNVSGTYVVRISGYARFANRYVPANGTKGSLLGIYAVYSRSTDDSTGSFQVTPCSFEDIFPEYYESLTEADQEAIEQWAKDELDGGSIPHESWYLPLTMNEDDEE